MKKYFIIPLMLIYLSAVSGIMINLHYCGTELSSWSVNEKGDGCTEGECGDESEGKNDDCCKDKTIVAKLSHEQNLVSEWKQIATTEAVIFATHDLNSQVAHLSISDIKPTSYQSNAPPGLWQDIPLYKLLSSYTYYG